MKFLYMFRDWEDVEEYPAQTIIYSEGDPADLMYVVISGEIALTLNGESLGTEEKGGIIGEMAMVNSATRNAKATALTEVKLARLDRDQFRKLIGKNTDFSLHVMTVLASRLRAVDKYISTHLEQLE